MLTCKEYIFDLTSGRAAEATGWARLQAAQHRLMCRRCRAFTRNDGRLDDILKQYRHELARPAAEDDAG